jgi:hypothetical protein
MKEPTIHWRVDYSRAPHHARRLRAALEEYARKQEAKEKPKR